MIENLSLLQKAALLTGKSVWETYDFPQIGLRSIWLADGPHGVRKQLGSADHLGLGKSEKSTCFPTSAGLANTWDPQLAEEVGVALGAEAAAQDVDVLLGPGLNIKRSPLGGRNFEYFSEDPLLSGKMAAALVRGIQSRGVAACPKHYAANSQEKRRMASNSVVDERTLREIYLAAFGIVVREAQPRSIMTAYNEVNGVYANENPFLLKTVLREEFGFDGLVVTDWGGSNDIVAGIAAGSTLEMPCAGLDSARQIVAAVESGRLAEADVDARVAEILKLVAEAREPGTAPAVDQAAHHALARKVAARAAVLLKNDSSMLPLASGVKVAIIGDFAKTPRYQGSGSSLINPTRLDSFLDVVQESDLDVVGFAQGFQRDGTPDEALRVAAVELAGKAEVALLFLGLDEVAESEGIDRTTLALHPTQIELLAAVAAANPNVVVVLAGGGVVELPWLDKTHTLLHGYLGGQAGAGGILDILTGAVNPSGRLAETSPLALTDHPTAQSFPATGRNAEYREGLYVGYRYFATGDVPVAFPFGYGLSYTSFAYANLSATANQATLTITNTGEVTGADVVQVYVSRKTPGAHRPSRTLAGFVRVELEPGEAREVTVPLGTQAWQHWDVETSAWQVETGTWEVLAGANVGDLPLSASVEVTGTIEARTEATLPEVYRTGQVAEVSIEDFAGLLGYEIPTESNTNKLGPNDPLLNLVAAPSPLARFIGRKLIKRRTKFDALGKPDLNTHFQLNMPPRAIGKMTGGLVDQAMVGGLLRIINGNFLRGLGITVRAYFRNRKANKATLRELRGDN
ncbi:MAG: glycoside hydrolase family 3 C-terminal domain-containing protein [Promicromonosporaceae bacterium]|nr:glycoside hydrolase family 3 C-terminal domain-containing protein [Promicromonosporaceae bacterium]